MKILYRCLLVTVLVVCSCLTACQDDRPLPSATFTQAKSLTPSSSPTPSHTPMPSARPTSSPPPKPTVTPTVTATPFLHALKNEDTLLGLAFFYGVSLEAIKTANPTVNPNFLTVGSSIIIPILATPAPTEPPTPTPVPVRLDAPACYPTADGGLWCFVLATNEQANALEDLSAWVQLASVEGQVLRQQEAIPMLNRLPAQASLALMTFFTPPVPKFVTAYAELRNSLAVPISDTRYLTPTVQVEVVDILPGGLQAEIQGEVNLLGGPLSANVIWIAAMAYDADGQVVGMRKWEAAQPLQTGVGLPFTLSVYSLGPAIVRVELVVEARP